MNLAYASLTAPVSSQYSWQRTCARIRQADLPHHRWLVARGETQSEGRERLQESGCSYSSARKGSNDHAVARNAEGTSIRSTCHALCLFFGAGPSFERPDLNKSCISVRCPAARHQGLTSCACPMGHLNGNAIHPRSLTLPHTRHWLVRQVSAAVSDDQLAWQSSQFRTPAECLNKPISRRRGLRGSLEVPRPHSSLQQQCWTYRYANLERHEHPAASKAAGVRMWGATQNEVGDNVRRIISGLILILYWCCSYQGCS
jgi:hypothetical protein